MKFKQYTQEEMDAMPLKQKLLLGGDIRSIRILKKWCIGMVVLLIGLILITII